jgi:imidazolonepropionase-like amidohydrolase
MAARGVEETHSPAAEHSVMLRSLHPAVPAVLLILACSAAAVQAPRRGALREVNEIPAPASDPSAAIVDVTLIDGTGRAPIADAAVVVRGDRIVAAGRRSAVRVPAGARVTDGRGRTLLPGLIDAHFHLDGDLGLPRLFLEHGVTSVRDPGAWIEAYEPVRTPGAVLPRLFLCGPHLDVHPPAYPKDAYIARDPDEARRAVHRLVDQGASAIKVYFRLPAASIRAAVEAAHARGVPVTSHLEIVDAADAIEAGVDGIEHVTSFGTALVPPREAEAYRQSVLADNNARREGRYQVWSGADPQSERARRVLRLAAERGVFLSPTLAVFERREGDRNSTDVHVRGFRHMLAFTGAAKKAGVRVVIGSHSAVPHAKRGWAYQREMELLVEAGLTPMEAIVAGTMENARFFRAEKRIGSVQPGKLADLVLIDGDPFRDIRAMRRVAGVMLNGRWVVPPTPESGQSPPKTSLSRSVTRATGSRRIFFSSCATM